MITIFADNRLKSIFSKANQAKREIDRTVDAKSDEADSLSDEIQDLESRITGLLEQKDSKNANLKQTVDLLQSNMKKQRQLDALIEEFQGRLEELL